MDLKQFLDRLQIIPNYFNLNIVNISTTKLRCVLDESNKILSILDKNLGSFLSFLFEDLSACREKNTWVLKRCPQNINANAIKSVLLFQDGKLTEADKCVENLEKLSHDVSLMAEAKAEIANAYSTCDVKYFNIAIRMFEEAIEKCPNVYGWKYSLALIIRRCQHPSLRLLMPPALQNLTENFIKSKELFEDVLCNIDDTDFKALVNVEIATLYMWPNRDDVDFEKLGINIADVDNIIMTYICKALKLSDIHETVLSEIGRILRSLKRFEHARQILEKAVGIRATNTTCHHLALVLQEINGANTESVSYLEQSVELSRGFNHPAIIDLGKAYLRLSPPKYDKAIECGDRLLDTNEFMWMARGCGVLSRCYVKMARQYGITKAEKFNLHQKADNMNRKNLVYNALVFLKSLCLAPAPQDKFTRRELFDRDSSGNGDFYSHRYQVKKARYYCKDSTVFFKDLQLASYSVGALKEVIQKYLRSKRYEDCLDLVSILMVTEIPDILKIILGVMMEIVPIAIQINDLGLASSCFSRGITSFYNMDEAVGHVRLIYDRNSKDEAELIDRWLKEVGLNITRNDEDILAYMNREDALKTALSSNIVIICIFKDNNCDLLDDYPLYSVTHDKPVLIPLVVNGSKVSPVLNNHEPMIYPTTTDTRDEGLWLKTFGERIFEKYLGE